MNFFFLGTIKKKKKKITTINIDFLETALRKKRNNYHPQEKINYLLIIFYSKLKFWPLHFPLVQMLL